MEKKQYQVSTAFAFDTLIDELRVLGGSAGVEIVEGAHYTFIVSEKYFIRINSTASASLLFIENSEGYSVDVIISGAREGILAFSYGADEKYLEDVHKILVRLGAVVI